MSISTVSPLGGGDHPAPRGGQHQGVAAAAPSVRTAALVRARQANGSVRRPHSRCEVDRFLVVYSLPRPLSHFLPCPNFPLQSFDPRMLLRVAQSVSKFPLHVVPILTSTGVSPLLDNLDSSFNPALLIAPPPF